MCGWRYGTNLIKCNQSTEFETFTAFVETYGKVNGLNSGD